MGNYRVGYNTTTLVITAAAWDAPEHYFDSSTVKTSHVLTGTILPEVDGTAAYSPSWNKVIRSSRDNTSFSLTTDKDDSDLDGVIDVQADGSTKTKITVKKLNSAGAEISGSDRFYLSVDGEVGLSHSVGRLRNGAFDFYVDPSDDVGHQITVSVSPRDDTYPLVATQIIKFIEDWIDQVINADATIQISNSVVSFLSDAALSVELNNNLSSSALVYTFFGKDLGASSDAAILTSYDLLMSADAWLSTFADKDLDLSAGAAVVIPNNNLNLSSDASVMDDLQKRGMRCLASIAVLNNNLALSNVALIVLTPDQDVDMSSDGAVMVVQNLAQNSDGWVLNTVNNAISSSALVVIYSNLNLDMSAIGTISVRKPKTINATGAIQASDLDADLSSAAAIAIVDTDTDLSSDALVQAQINSSMSSDASVLKTIFGNLIVADGYIST